VEGLLGGIVSSVIVCLVAATLMKWSWLPPITILYGVVLGFISFVGDMSMSLLKRDAKMKDSGTLLPGHGGVLDRFDSFILTAPIAFLYLSLFPLSQ
jgi:phosphatidate cytidylyltransferase